MSNLKISQLEKITNMKEDSFVLAVQNGKNYKMSVKEAMNSYIDLSNYYTKEETVDTINDCIETFEVVSNKGNTTTIAGVVNTVETQGDKITELIAATDTAQSTADTALANAATAQSAADAAQDTANSAITSINTINNTTIPELQTSITSNTNLINTTKTELIGTENTDGTTIWGAKKYADEKAATAKAAADAAKDAADAAQSTADTAVTKAEAAQTAAETADAKAVTAQATADTLKNTTIPAVKSELEGKISDNTTLIGTTKAELIGGDLDTKNSNSIKGAKLYADDLASGLSKRIDSIVAGGVAFKGVVSELPSAPKNGDLVIIGKEGGIKVGDITYKKDYEYIYSEGAWYELGDSDKNAKAIAEVQAKATANATAISNMDTAYKAADTAIKQSIETLSNAAVKSVKVTDNSTYVTVTAGTKDNNGNVTLTVTDSIAATFDTQSSVNTKISTAKNELIGTKGQDGDTIWGAKKYADEAVKALSDSFVAITADEINALFA